MAAEKKVQLEEFSGQAADSLSIFGGAAQPWPAFLFLRFVGFVLEAAFGCFTETCSGADLCSVLVRFPDQNQNTEADSFMSGLCHFCSQS